MSLQNIKPVVLSTVTISAGGSLVDGMTSAARVIDYSHHEIHGGSSYVASVQQMVSDAGDRTTLGFTCAPGTKRVHMFASVHCSEDALFVVRENASVSGGTTHPAWNRHRGSTNTSTVFDISSGDTGYITYWPEANQSSVTENGNKLFETALVSGGGPQAPGGGNIRAESELILAPGSSYIFYTKSLDANDNYHSIILDWYEHTDSGL